MSKEDLEEKIDDLTKRVIALEERRIRLNLILAPKIPPKQLNTLSIMHKKYSDGFRVADLVKERRISPAGAYGNLRILERKGLIRSTLADIGSKKTYFLTEIGKEVVSQYD